MIGFSEFREKLRVTLQASREEFGVYYQCSVMKRESYVLIRSLVDTSLAAFIVCGPLQFVLLFVMACPGLLWKHKSNKN